MNKSGQINIIDGQAIASEIINHLKSKVSEFEDKPCLAIVLVGDDQGSHIYVGLKEKVAKQVGIKIRKYFFPKETKQEEVISLIKELNSDGEVNGILVQFPLPKHLDENTIIQKLDPMKDVDGFHPGNIDNLLSDRDCLVPGLAQGVITLIKSTEELLLGKKAVVVANSAVFSQPLEFLLKKESLGVVVTNAKENSFAIILKEADILIVAIGRPNFIKGEMIKRNAIIIDVGYNLVDGKSVGDVDYESVKNKAGWITPVPGGVGPMTVAMLLNNVLNAYEKQKSLHI